MQEKLNDRQVERVSLGVLQQQARSFREERSYLSETESMYKSREAGRRFRTCSVYSFYEPFLLDRREAEEETRMVQEWIADSIEVMLGEGDTRSLTMEELAGRIAKALNEEDLADEDRWALYELCFLLTAQMCTLKDEFFSTWEQCIRWGTPDEHEPLSLYRRVTALRNSRNASQTQTSRNSRVSLKKLLTTARGYGDKMSERARRSLPCLTAGTLMQCLLAAKYNVNDAVKSEMLALMERTQRFEEMFRTCTGEELDEDSSLAELAAVMTWKFKLDAESREVSRVQVLQAYELCYEFIDLLADEEYDKGHVSLMEREGLADSISA